jgi:hypothetical protein
MLYIIKRNTSNKNHSCYRKNARLTTKNKSKYEQDFFISFQCKNEKIYYQNFNCNQSNLFKRKTQKKKKKTLTLILIIGTQTDNYLSIQGQYQYKNLRRVNSDLLDYIFIPMSE